ncbi:MAG TPA: hypothetical protein PLI18_14990 [Pirellulaceae bacterium]|nr:hypothetical protein [Pirellulaceae bacterium]
MRLTLRTLLAHLDGVLDRNDDEVLAKKIAESDYARRLIDRIDDVGRRPRLAPPRVDAREGATDPNAMADYLDGMLDPAAVAEHEKACLASDALLAEASVCHQILSCVVREPLKISERTRRRLGKRVAAALDGTIDVPRHRIDPPAPPIGRDADRVTGSPRLDDSAADLEDDDDEEWIDVPAADTAIARPNPLERTAKPNIAAAPLQPNAEGTGGRPSNLAPLASTSSGAAELPQLKPVRRPASPPVESSDVMAPRAASSSAASPSATPKRSAAANADRSPAAPLGNASHSALETPPELMPGPPIGDLDPLPSVEPVRRSSRAALLITVLIVLLLLGGTLGFLALSGELSRWTDRSRLASAPSADRSDRSADPANGAAVSETALPTESNRNDSESETSDRSNDSVAGGAAATLPAAEVTPEASDSIVAVDANDAAGNDVPTPIPSGEIAVGEATIWSVSEPVGMTLVQAPGANGWSFLASGQPLPIGAWIQTMPIDVVVLQGSDGRQLELRGASRFRLVPATRTAAPALAIDYGRFVFRGSSTESAGVEVRIGDRPTWLVGTTVDSIAALEVLPWQEPGATFDQRTGSPARIVTWIAGGAPARVIDAEGTTTLAAGSGLSRLNDRIVGSGTIGSLPSWIDRQDELERSAALAIARLVDRGADPVSVWHALSSHERPEVRITASECLAEVGLYEAMWRALDDDGNRSAWRRRLIASTERQLARGEGRAQRVIDAADDATVGRTAIELWQGVSPDQLAAGEGNRLVAGLEHPRLVIRSLAFEQLLRITGNTGLFLPEADEASRRLRVTEWRRRLEAGTIAWAEPPQLPIPDYVANR